MYTVIWGGITILYVFSRQCADLISEPLGSKSPPEPFCVPPMTPLLSTMLPTDTGSLLTSSSPSEGILGNKCNFGDTQSLSTGYNTVRNKGCSV